MLDEEGIRDLMRSWVRSSKQADDINPMYWRGGIQALKDVLEI